MKLIKPKQLRRKITKKVKKIQFSKKNIFFKKKRKKKKYFGFPPPPSKNQKFFLLKLSKLSKIE